MFELPEVLNLVEQMNETLVGKTICVGHLGNSPHKFVWYNREPAEFEMLTQHTIIGQARAQGRWLSIPLHPGYVLLFGECGGRILYHPAGSPLLGKYHLHLAFEDGSFLTALTQMWGAMELYEAGKEQERTYVKDMRPTPVEPTFTFEYFSALIDSLLSGERRSIKGLLTQEQLIPGLGNAIAQDILFRARLHPKHPLDQLGKAQRRKLYHAILKTVREIAAQGGRYDEYDLFNQPGRYARLMDSQAVDRPCPACGARVQKIQYLGGACYFCSSCQT
jgi:formamidopyrimidine-DNA glycosylase